MADWFTVERLAADTFAISEYRHWEQTHCYLLLGQRSALLLDSGLGVGDIAAVVRGLTALPVVLATTHVHWDHIGGHAQFADIAVHAAEAAWLDGHFPLPRAAVLQNLLRQPCDFPPQFDAARYRIFQGAPQRVVRDGDWLELGGRRLQAVHTPGHSPGHCCWWEPARGDLYCGDLLYAGCLDAWYPTTDPVQFSASVRRVCRLPFARLLPGHYRLQLPNDLAARTAAAFETLAAGGRLRQGAGLFAFGDFQIHL